MARQALTIGGAIVGSFFGYPQLGFVIGSIVGNYVDPQVIKTPGIQDLPVQTASEGGYRQVVYGTCWINQTNIIDFGEVRRVTRRERQGKGGGPVVESERLYRTYAIGLGEPLEAIRVIRRDGKIVYDVRPGSTILADSAKFAERFRFYTGAEDQLPDPDLEALPHNGVGNTPYYRGTAYLVFPNDDLTDTQGRIPTYEVEAVQAGATVPQGTWFYGPVAENGAAGGSELFYLKADSPGALVSATPAALPTEGDGAITLFSVANGAVFMARATLGCVSFDNGATWAECNIPLDSTLKTYWNGAYYFNGGNRSADGITWAAMPATPGSGAKVCLGRTSDGALISILSNIVYKSLDNAASWTLAWNPGVSIGPEMVTNGTRIWYRARTSALQWTDDLFATVGEFGGGNVVNLYYGEDEVAFKALFVTSAGRFEFDNSGFAVTITGINLANTSDENIAYGDGVWALDSTNTTPSPNEHTLHVSGDGAATWSAVSGTLYGTGNNLAFCPYGGLAPVPDDATTLETIVADIADRCGLDATEIDMSALDEVVVDGVTLGGGYNGADAITLFMPAYFFDLVQPEKVLTAVVRGGASLAAVTADDFVEEPDENLLRGQDIEFPRVLMLKYLNPGQNYAAPAAVVSRTSPDVRVSGEATTDLPISFNETGALQVADRMLKVMWEDLNGEVTFSLPSGPWAWLTPTDILTLSLRGGVYRIRVEKVEESAGVLKVTARRDRHSAYTSNLTAPSLPTPTPPPPALAGDTTFVVMNLPALVDGDDALGVYIAMTGGEDTAWSGAQVEYRVQGAADWTVLGTYTTRAVMGELLANLPAASAHYTDTTNPLSVSLVYTADQLESLTYAQFLSEGNPFAIVNSDFTAEIGQFRYAVDDSNSDWTLTTLQRGRLNTTAGAHSTGDTFVMLDGAIFLPLPTSVIGQTLEFRVTSIGNSPETAPTQTMVWAPQFSQYEFPPADIALSTDGTDISVSWSPRLRFGTEDNPIASANLLGYRVEATDGVTTKTTELVAGTSHTIPESFFAGSVTVTVYPVNRFTGLGPSIAGTIDI